MGGIQLYLEKKSFKQRLYALLTAFAICLCLPMASFTDVVSADEYYPDDYTQQEFRYDGGTLGVYANTEDEYHFVVSGYDSSSSITDPTNPDIHYRNVRGKAYCLDYKLTPPAGHNYKRVRLSEMNMISGKYKPDKQITDAVKTRLIKLIMAKDEIINYANSIDLSAEYTWLEAN